MLQNPCKTLGFKKNMVYKIPPGGEVNHIQPVAYEFRGALNHSDPAKITCLHENNVVLTELHGTCIIYILRPSLARMKTTWL